MTRWTEKGPVAERKRYLRQLAGSFDDLPVKTMVRLGEPADEVISLMEQLPNPVIVLASHGRVGAGRAILGSIAFSIVHGVQCPVLIVPTPPSEYHIPVMPERGTALVPLDGSFFSETALTRPLRVLGKPEFALHLLYVVVPATDVTGIPIDAFIGPKEEWATHYLESVAERLTRQGSSGDMVGSHWGSSGADPVGRRGDRRRSGCDGDAGRHGIGRMLFGSVTERIAHEANVPLPADSSRTATSRR